MNLASQRLWWGIVGIGSFGLLVGIDIVTEGEIKSVGEFVGDALELALIVASATGVAVLSGSLQREREERRLLARDLDLARAEGEAWRARAQGYLVGLSKEIAAQFDQWQLTESEREVGLLMLKGFSHAEIASLRGTSEATVRHQARAVYQKSGMPGRSAFCAYFLEDLLPGNGKARAGVPASHAAPRAAASGDDASRHRARRFGSVDGAPGDS